MRMHLLASFELVFRSAVGAFCVAVFGHVEEDTRVIVPDFHACLFARAEDSALGVKVLCGKLDGFVHGLPLDLAEPRRVFWIASVDDVKECALDFFGDWAA